MNLQSYMPNQFGLGVLPDFSRYGNIGDFGNEYNKDPQKTEYPLHKNYYDFSYATGLLNTGLQAAAGVIIMGLALFGNKKKTGKHKIENLFEGKSARIFKTASAMLGVGYFIGFPSVTGAGIKSEQPGMVLASAMWLAATPFMIMGKLGTRTRAFLDIAYAPVFAGFANQINNDFGTDKDKKQKKMNLEYLFDRESYLNVLSPGQAGRETRAKWFDFMKFCVTDQVTAVKTVAKSIVDTTKQSFNVLTGKREDLPDIFSIKPSKESMSFGSLFILAGTIPKLYLGKKIKGKKEFIADILIGAGFLFESLGMMSLANTKDDSRRIAMLIGGPMRIIGDFRHENPFMYGLRTLGGSSFEYYWTLMNKD